jgi:beta-phosphoglucomutase
MLRAMIFDFDGVIADTEPLHFRAFQQVLNGTVWELSHEEYFSRYLGLTDAAMLRKLAEDRRLAGRGDEWSLLLQGKYEAYLGMIEDGMEVTPGLEQFLASIPASIPLAICSGARRREIELILRHNRMRERFMSIVSCEDVPTSKPDPTGYRLAFQHLLKREPTLSVSETLAIEDSQLGLEAAKAAGLRTMAIKPVGSMVDVSAAESAREDFRNLTFEKLCALYK